MEEGGLDQTCIQTTARQPCCNSYGAPCLCHTASPLPRGFYCVKMNQQNLPNFKVGRTADVAFVCVLAGDLWSPHSALASLSRSLPNKCLPARHKVSVPTWLVPGDVTLELCPHSGQHQNEGQGSPHFPQWVLCHPYGYTDLLTKVLA